MPIRSRSSIVAAILALALSGSIAQAAEAEIRDLSKLVDQACLVHDFDTLELIRWEGKPALPLIEKKLDLDDQLSPGQIHSWVVQLASPEKPIRDNALQSLKKVGSRAAQPIAAEMDRQSEALQMMTSVSEINAQKALIASYIKARNEVASVPGARVFAPVLKDIYAKCFDELFDQRWALFEKDINNKEAVRFLTIADFNSIWAKLDDSRRADRLKLLLLIRYAGVWKESLHQQKLKQYSAKEVLDAIKSTYWPIQLEPLALDGAYAWTTYANRIQGNIAENTLRLSVDGDLNKNARWVHLKHNTRIAYLFRLKPQLLNNDCLVFQNAPDPAMGISKRYSTQYSGITSARGIPSTAILPIIQLTEDQLMGLRGEKLFEVTRPFIPEYLAAPLRFEPHTGAEPKITIPPGYVPPSTSAKTKP